MKKTDQKLLKIILTAFIVLTFLILTVFLNLKDNINVNEAFKTVGLKDKNIATKQDFCAYFIDVGQGDCSLIKSGNKYMLIDAGNISDGEKIEEFLKSVGCNELEYVVATHPHADHIGGMAYVINKVKVKNVLMPDIPDEIMPTTKTFINLLNAVKISGAKVYKAQQVSGFELGKAKVKVLSPKTDFDSLNNMSVVMKITYGEKSFLFTGDMEKEAENNVLKELGKNKEDLNCDVLKVAHHGGSTSSTKPFVKEVSPTFAVISCGLNNSYHHPHPSVLKTLNENDVKIYRTDKNGTVYIGTDGEKLFCYTND